MGGYEYVVESSCYQSSQKSGHLLVIKKYNDISIKDSFFGGDEGDILGSDSDSDFSDGDSVSVEISVQHEELMQGIELSDLQ